MFYTTLLPKISLVIIVIFGSLIGSNTVFARYFVQNVGQVTDQHFHTRKDIDFKLSGGNGLNVFVGSDRIHYQFAKQGADSNTFSLYRLDVELLGANPNAKIITGAKTGSFERYYTSGLEGVKAYQYRSITYMDIYPNIDWTLYFTPDGKLEYDFVVRPGGRISEIQMKYAGADELKIINDGSLTARTPFGLVTENAPVAYQQKDQAKIASAFRLDGNILSFSTAAYSGTLVIDPVLEWATYFGGSEYDVINAMAYGRDGSIYAVGNTNSVSNIATTGAYQTTFGGGNNTSGADAFIVKFDTTGVRQWATYYGGTNVDQVNGVAVDTAGYIYMAGRTNSQAGIATPGTHQEIKAGTAAGYDAFLVKFDTAGTRQWGTYFGGAGAEGSNIITLACDGQNNLYLAGNTASTDGIATSGAHQVARSGTQDGFLAQFNDAGTVQWGTYFGGSSTDFINAVTADMDGNVYITGYTGSSDGIATTGTHQTVNAGGTDAFVAKFNATGVQLWGSYLGGAALDQAASIATDGSGYVYLAGITASTVSISTANAHQTAYGGGSLDIFLSKFHKSGTMEWATYYGGAENDYNPFLSIGNSGTVYLTGTTNSPDGIATQDAIMPIYSHNGHGKVLLTAFDTSGVRIYATYLGGTLSEWSTSVVSDVEGHVYLGGYTASTDLATTGAYQDIFGGNRDGYLLKIDMCFLPGAPDTIIGALQICSHTPVTYYVEAVAGADAYEWLLPPGWSGTSVTDSITVLADVSGTIRVAAVNGCGHSDTIELTINVLPSPALVLRRNANILTTTQPFVTYQWNRNGQPITGATQPTYAVTENGSYTVTVTANNGCEGTSDAEDFTGLSAAERSTAQFNIYPNPARETVSISMEKAAILEIYDVTGRCNIERTALTAGENNVDISYLNDGMYIIRLYGADGSHMGEAKLIKVAE